MRDLKTTIKLLERNERISNKKGFGGDATNHAFKRHVLILLDEIANKEKRKPKRKPTEYQKRVGKFMKEGHALKQAHLLAKSTEKEKEEKKK